MKSKLILTFAIGLLLGSHAHGQGTFVYDQQSSTENFYGEGGSDIDQNQPLGQSFTPSLSAVGFIRLRIENDLGGNRSQANIAINLRSDSITGPILGTSEIVSIPGGVLFADNVDFLFNMTVTVQPGTTYYFQPFVLNNNNLILTRSIFYNYPGGMAYIFGNPDPGSDIWFREGIIVPEPSTMALVLLSGGFLFRFKPQRRRDDF